jgi:hypothetical protein
MTSTLLMALCARARITPPLLIAGVALTQHPPLTPTVNTTIVVPVGELHYSSIDIPIGVTVRFVAPGFGGLSIPGMPAIVRCDGDANVRGTISLTGVTINDRPAGWVNAGQGLPGTVCDNVLLWPAGGGRHDYGSIFPFTLEGGSPGGPLHFWGTNCAPFLNAWGGGKGGGTLVLLASGRIDIYGTITADGQIGPAGGSGGSILLRGDAGVHIRPGGSVTARGGPAATPPFLPMSVGQDGYIRFDSWATPPLIQGTVNPPPIVVSLPHLRAPSQPTIGTTWTVEVYAPDTGPVYVAAALAPANVPTIFGTVGLDLTTAAGIAFATPTPSHDPLILVQWPIPNTPSLVGFAMWLQAIAAPQNLNPWVSNTIAVVVQ